MTARVNRNKQSMADRLVIPVVLVLLLVGLAALDFTGYVINTSRAREGKISAVDHIGFAQCLARSGAVLYTDRGEASASQLRMFQGGAPYLERVDCTENICDADVFPSWDIYGRRYSGVMPLGTLEDVTGCDL